MEKEQNKITDFMIASPKNSSGNKKAVKKQNGHKIKEISKSKVESNGNKVDSFLDEKKGLKKAIKPPIL